MSGTSLNATYWKKRALKAEAALTARPEGGDTKRLEWIFSALNDEAIKAKIDRVSDTHAFGALDGIHMGDWRAAIDLAMRHAMNSGSNK